MYDSESRDPFMSPSHGCVMCIIFAGIPVTFHPCTSHSGPRDLLFSLASLMNIPLMLDKTSDIYLTQIQVNSFQTMSAFFGVSHDLESPCSESLFKGQLQRFYKLVSYERAVKILKLFEFKVKFQRKILKIRNFANVSIIRVEQ